MVWRRSLRSLPSGRVTALSAAASGSCEWSASADVLIVAFLVIPADYSLSQFPAAA
jgi:hypothetical protein